MGRSAAWKPEEVRVSRGRKAALADRLRCCGYSLLTSASVFSALVTDNSPSPVASDRASIRSTLLFTTPASVTWPPSTMMSIGGFAIDAEVQNDGVAEM